MKIQDKFFVAFGIYITLAAVIGFFAYSDLRSITKRLTLVEVADDTTNTILEVRRFEKNFLLYRDNNSLRELQKYLSILKSNVDHIAVEIIKDIGTDNYTMMKEVTAEYERLITKIALNFQSQEELATTLRAAGKEIEKRLRGNELRSFLIVRRQEKNLIHYKDSPTYATFVKAIESLNVNGEIERYRILADKLAELYTDEKDSVERMRLKAREIQSFTETLSKREREKIGAILRTSKIMLLLALLAIFIVGLIVNIKFARNIATPIRKLERVTKKIAMGDFSEVIEVKGKDEITSLEISFNQMEDRLKDTLSSLELAVRNLHEKQAQLVEARKLASIGILAAGIAHEINNPLTSILTFSNLMLEQTPEGDPRRERLKMMARETERARIIVRQILSFAKETPLKKAKKSVNCPINEMVETLAAQETFKDIEVDLDLSENLPETDIDSVRIEQVILNMLLNAVHAITPPGKVTVETRVAGDFVEIVISDTGCGIPEEDLSRIFDPFYTTKARGSGLGLAVSYGIIKKHGGDIEVRSAVGKGTTFIIRLPMHEN